MNPINLHNIVNQNCFQDRILVLIAQVPDHCLQFTFIKKYRLCVLSLIMLLNDRNNRTLFLRNISCLHKFVISWVTCKMSRYHLKHVELVTFDSNRFFYITTVMNLWVYVCAYLIDGGNRKTTIANKQTLEAWYFMTGSCKNSHFQRVSLLHTIWVLFIIN